MSSKQRNAAAPGLIKRVFAALRGLPDRLLHGHRHRAVRDQLAQMDRPRRMLVVCYGNICRSPYLHAVLARALPDIRIDSAGFFEPGRPVPPHARTLAAQRGLDLSEFRSHSLVPTVVREADLVIVMDGYQSRHMRRYYGVARSRIVVAGDLDPLPSFSRTIADPWELRRGLVGVG